MHISQQKSIDKHHKYDDIKGLLEQTAATKNSQKSKQIKIQQLFQALVYQLSKHYNQIDQIKVWRQITEQLESFPLHRRILTAIIESGSFNLKYASHPFYELMGRARSNKLETQQNIKLNELLSDWENTELEKLYPLQILYWILKQLYQIDISNLQFQDYLITSGLTQRNPISTVNHCFNT